MIWLGKKHRDLQTQPQNVRIFILRSCPSETIHCRKGAKQLNWLDDLASRCQLAFSLVPQYLHSEVRETASQQSGKLCVGPPAWPSCCQGQQPLLNFQLASSDGCWAPSWILSLENSQCHQTGKYNNSLWAGLTCVTFLLTVSPCVTVWGLM